MVRTRLDTKFSNWTFKLKEDELFIALIPFSSFCSKISFEYDHRTGYIVNAALHEPQRFDDIVEDLSWFVYDVYPQVTYVELSNQVPKCLAEEKPVDTKEDTTKWWVYVLWLWSFGFGVTGVIILFNEIVNNV